MKVRYRRSPRDRYATAAAAKRRLRWLLAVFFLALGVPVYLLIGKVYAQLEQETYYRYRAQAEALVDRVERRMHNVLEAEQQRPFAQYSFFNVLESPLLQSKGVTFSPLSELPPESDVPGIVGYFQIDPDGSFHSPVLPDSDRGSTAGEQPGFSQAQLAKRLALRNRLRRLLLANPRPVPDVSEQRAQRGNDMRGERERAHDGERKQEVAKAGDDRYVFDRLLPPSATIAPPLAEESTADESRTSRARADKDAGRISASQLAAVEGIGRKSAAQSSTKTAAAAVASSPAPKAKPTLHYRRKEKVRLPDQAAARALFDRPRRQAMEAASSTPESTMLAREAESDRLHGAIEKKNRVAASEEQESPVAIFSFDSEIDRLQMIALDASYDCFFRRVWREDGRYIQGFIIERGEFFRQMVTSLFRGSTIASVSRLRVADDGNVVQQVEPLGYDTRSLLARQDRPAEPAETLPLYRARLADPLQQVDLLFNVGALPLGKGALLIDLTAFTLAAVLLIGLAGFYRLGVRQIQLAQQKSDFVAAVSHELKTPLTTIRLYSEMLRSGWAADEQRKKTYYDHIFFESERLSRLIANVLQLSKLENHGDALSLQPLTPARLLEGVRQALATQVAACGFELNMRSDDTAPADLIVTADVDAFARIMINLVDNALKFAAEAEPRRIEVGWTVECGGEAVLFFVRDYGPGIRRDQRKKIFDLFYRSGDEMTRTKPGTGIGLALVKQLAAQMGAVVDLVDRRPGVEFQLRFPLPTQAGTDRNA